MDSPAAKSAKNAEHWRLTVGSWWRRMRQGDGVPDRPTLRRWIREGVQAARQFDREAERYRREEEESKRTPGL